MDRWLQLLPSGKFPTRGRTNKHVREGVKRGEKKGTQKLVTAFQIRSEIS